LTDTLGNFHLDHVSFPCELVISHLSYQTHSIFLENAPVNPLDITIQLKVNEIKEVSIQDRNLREQNLQMFKDRFLGTNVWGKDAVIKNEGVILFTRDYKLRESKVFNKKLFDEMLTAPDLEWSADSTTVTYSAPYNLKAKSLSPLEIQLPLLGYTLYYDLTGFEWNLEAQFGSDLTTILGYSYFVPVDYKSKRDSIRIEKNRLKVYYNSAQHFCKSLFENNLEQNGYVLVELQEQKPVTDKTAKSFNSPNIQTIIDNKLVSTSQKVTHTIKVMNIDTCMHWMDKYALLTGLKGRKFDIYYYSTNNNKPKDLTLLKGVNGLKSKIIITKDTCMIRNDGTVPDNSIIFGLTIGDKKLGAMLPGDYKPFR